MSRLPNVPPRATCSEPTTQASVSLEVEDGRSMKRAGACGALQLGLLGLVVIAFAVGLGGLIVGAVLTGRLDDLESKVYNLQATAARLQATAAITEGLAITRSAEPPAGYAFGGSLHAGAGEWAPAVHMPEERSDLQAVACAGVIVVLGGINLLNETQQTAWAFNPIAEVWDTNLPQMPTGRFRFAAACLAGYVYVAGGYDSFANGEAGKCLASVDRYDVARRSWVSVAPLKIARGDLALAPSAGKI